MLNNSDGFSIGLSRYLIFAIISGLIALTTDIDTNIVFSGFLYHEGEYTGLIWHMRSYYSGDIKFPLLIHGSMDYIPSIISSKIYGDNHIIVGTRAINTFIVLICWIVFLDLCYVLTPSTNQRIAWMIMILALFYAMAPKLHSDSLTIHAAFLSVRDLFLISAIRCFAQYTTSVSRKSGRVFLVLGAVSTVMAIFWSYDRGLLALAFLAIICLGIIYKKKILDAAVMLIAVCFTALILEFSGIFGSFAENAYNIIYWIKNGSEIFGKNISDPALVWVVFLIYIFCLAAMTLACVEKYYQDAKFLPFVSGLFVVQILLLMSIMNRPDMPRLFMAVWPSVLIMIYVMSRNVTKNAPPATSSSDGQIAPVPLLYKLNFAILIMLMSLTSSWFFWTGSLLKSLIVPRPDIKIAAPDVVELATALKQYDDECVFGWTNEGIITLLAKKRFCTRFTYAIYVSKSEEATLLRQLKADLPKAIAFEISGISMMDLDGKPMSTRLPKVYEFIKNNYRTEKRIGRYLIVSK